jgi:hypothetical protein
MVMSRYGITASTIADAILSAWGTLQAVGGGLVSGGTGCIQTIARIPDDSHASIERGCEGGLPALLLCYMGGKYDDRETSNARFVNSMRFRLIGCTGDGRDLKERFTGGEIDPTKALIPGVEDICDWALYFAARAARTAGGRLVHPDSSSQTKEIKAGLFAAYVDLVASREVDVYSDAVAATFARLGICKNTTGGAHDLFQIDNVTPKSNDPNPGGVYTPTP